MPADRVRVRDAERTRAEILDVATRHFAQRGYSGARVDEIAAETRTAKRMIYYYFAGKEQLYIAVLERAYARIRELERALDVEHLDPISAIRQLAAVTFDHHEAHPDFVRLVSMENIHQAQHIVKSAVLAQLNTTATDVVGRILDAGRRSGMFCRQVDAIDVHLVISMFCIFRIANRFTFGAIFGRDPADPLRREHYRAMLGDLVVAYLTTSQSGPEQSATTASTSHGC